MEGTETDVLGASLLHWVKSFNEAGKIEGWKDLSAGQHLWKTLYEVDPEYFSASLPEPDVEASGDWTRKWQNLKYIDKQVSLYYRDVCNGQEDVGASSIPDLKGIAADASPRELEKFIMLIIRAAMTSPASNQRMAQRLMSLGRETAMVIATELRNMEEADHTESEPVSRDESAYDSEQEIFEETKPNGTKGGQDVYRDPLLEREEELLQAQATIEKLQASQAAAQRQLQELRQDKEKMQEAFDAYRAEIDAKGRKHGADDSFKKLERQAANDRAYIEDLESQLQSTRNTVDSYERQLERHKADHEATQKLRDDLQVLRAENEDLNQKIKANENLKKKIQTLQDHERANVQLREDLKQLNERLEALEQLRSLHASLEKEIIEKKGLIRNQEYQINELTTTRKHAEYDARVFAQKLEAARERHGRDHEAMEELRLKLQDTIAEEAQVDETPQEQNRQLGDHEQERPPPRLSNDESKHLAQKLALVEQQLEAADARLKQTAQRNALLEEQNRNNEAAAAAAAQSESQAKMQVAKHESTIADLHRQLEIAQKQPQREKATPAQDLATLQRENHLMTTAWYDLSSRLQSNGVSLGRRRYEPKSWIGKQRALVGANSGLR